MCGCVCDRGHTCFNFLECGEWVEMVVIIHCNAVDIIYCEVIENKIIVC
jgi:hypothetical protein